MTPAIVGAVRRFVEAEVRPVAAVLEHADAYPHALVARLTDLGLFGALIPPAHRGLGLDVPLSDTRLRELHRRADHVRDGTLHRQLRLGVRQRELHALPGDELWRGIPQLFWTVGSAITRG